MLVGGERVLDDRADALKIRGQQDASTGRHHVGAGTPSGHATHADTAGTVRAQIMAADLQGSGRRLTGRNSHGHAGSH